MRSQLAIATSVLVAGLLLGCSSPSAPPPADESPSPALLDSSTIAACEDFERLVADMAANGAWANELSGDTFEDFLDDVDTAALSADDEIVRDRMLTFIEELPPNYLISDGNGLESFVDLNNDVARACEAAGAPITSFQVGS